MPNTHEFTPDHRALNALPVCVSDRYLDPAAADNVPYSDEVPLISGLLSAAGMLQHTPKHRRNIHETVPTYIQGELVDQYGSTYPVATIKGGYLPNPQLQHSQIDPNDVKVNGLFDASTADRCIRVSRVLREAGVLTEWPFYFARPKEWWLEQFQCKTGNLVQFKQKIAAEYEQHQKYLRDNPDNVEDVAHSIGRYGNMLSGLANTNWGVLYRGFLSASRLWDLSELPRRKAEEPELSIEEMQAGIGSFADMVRTTATPAVAAAIESLAGVSVAPTPYLESEISGAIRALQQREPRDFIVWEDVASLDPENPDDQQRYMTSVLPKIMGENIARMHNAGAYHKYLHPGNITLAGEIVDLDSVRHASISDEDIDFTPEHLLYEATYAALSLVGVALVSDVHVAQLFNDFVDSYLGVRNVSYDSRFVKLITHARFMNRLNDGLAILDYGKNVGGTFEPLVTSVDDALDCTLMGKVVLDRALAMAGKIPVADAQDNGKAAYERVISNIERYLKDNGLEAFANIPVEFMAMCELANFARAFMRRYGKQALRKGDPTQ